MRALPLAAIALACLATALAPAAAAGSLPSVDCAGPALHEDCVIDVPGAYVCYVHVGVPPQSQCYPY
jgi:hypothetical protein